MNAACRPNSCWSQILYFPCRCALSFSITSERHLFPVHAAWSHVSCVDAIRLFADSTLNVGLVLNLSHKAFEVKQASLTAAHAHDVILCDLAILLTLNSVVDWLLIIEVSVFKKWCTERAADIITWQSSLELFNFSAHLLCNITDWHGHVFRESEKTSLFHCDWLVRCCCTFWSRLNHR